MTSANRRQGCCRRERGQELSTQSRTNRCQQLGSRAVPIAGSRMGGSAEFDVPNRALCAATECRGPRSDEIRPVVF